MPTTLVVKATQSGGANGMALRVYCITGAKPVSGQTGVTVPLNVASGTVYNAAGTIQQSSSFIYGAIDHGNVTNTAVGGVTLVDDIADTTNGEKYTTFKWLTPTAGSQTLGTTAGAITAGGLAWMEILAQTTLAEDGNSPAVASTTSAQNVSTASFNAPDGCLLVALVSSDGGAGVTTMAMSTTTGPALTWTEKVKANNSGLDYCGIWIADAPSASGGASYAPARPGQTWRRQFAKPYTAPVYIFLTATTPLTGDPSGGVGGLWIAGAPATGTFNLVGTPTPGHLSISGPAQSGLLGLTGTASAGHVSIAGAQTSGGTALTGTPNSGHITIGGPKPTGTFDLLGTPGPGHVTIAGPAESGTFGLTGTASSGHVAIAGAPASGGAALVGTPSSGHITIRGPVATGTFDLLATPGAGHITIRGPAQSGLFGLTATPGSGLVWLAGAPASGGTALLGNPNPGHITIRGPAATGTFGLLGSPTPGHISIRGGSATGTYALVGSVLAGSVWVAGATATGSLAGTLVPGVMGLGPPDPDRMGIGSPDPARAGIGSADVDRMGAGPSDPDRMGAGPPDSSRMH